MSDSTIIHESKTVSIPGYSYGQPGTARSPVSLQELRQIEGAVGWTEKDAQVLRDHQEIFKNNAEQMVDAWRAVIGSQRHLAELFFAPDGKPDEDYKARVRKRFVQWVEDACVRSHDQAWLDYQEEIGLRHLPDKKNKTDGAHTASTVPLRYLMGFVSVIITTSRKFFIDAGVQGEELRKLEDAWMKSVQLHVTFWARPYAKENLW